MFKVNNKNTRNTLDNFYTIFIVPSVDFEQNTIKCSNNKLLQ